MTDFVVPRPGVPTIPLERIDLSSDLAARYVAESKPFVARVDWPACRWTPELLRERVGSSVVSMLKYDGDYDKVTVSRYLDLVENHAAAKRDYVMHNFPVMRLWGTEHNGANPQFESLIADLKLPAWSRPRAGFIWASNKGAYDNKSHCEPNACPGLNLQILGKKHVYLFPPEDAGPIGAASPIEDMMGPPCFSANQTVYAPSPEHPKYANVRCYEAVLEPGDIIHVPTFWYHWFIHYNLYQLNVNVWFGVDQIPTTPVSAEWAYMNALCLNLGGWDEAPDAFKRLPAETQTLLHRIAKTLIEDRRCTDVQQWLDAKFLPKGGQSDMGYRPQLFEKPTGEK